MKSLFASACITAVLLVGCGAGPSNTGTPPDDPGTPAEEARDPSPW
ncbi:hypothetical protein ACN28S_39240 [Cystobacter fuscus]